MPLEAGVARNSAAMLSALAVTVFAVFRAPYARCTFLSWPQLPVTR